MLYGKDEYGIIFDGKKGRKNELKTLNLCTVLSIKCGAKPYLFDF